MLEARDGVLVVRLNRSRQRNARLPLGPHMEADQFALLVASAEGRAARARFAERKKP